jgi:hypothetical protein
MIPASKNVAKTGAQSASKTRRASRHFERGKSVPPDAVRARFAPAPNAHFSTRSHCAQNASFLASPDAPFSTPGDSGIRRKNGPKTTRGERPERPGNPGQIAYWRCAVFAPENGRCLG